MQQQRACRNPQVLVFRVDAHPGINAYNNKLAMKFAEKAIEAAGMLNPESCAAVRVVMCFCPASFL